MHGVHIDQDVIHIVDAPAECAVSEIDDEFGADDETVRLTLRSHCADLSSPPGHDIPDGDESLVCVECPPTGVIEARFDGVVLGDVIDVDWCCRRWSRCVLSVVL